MIYDHNIAITITITIAINTTIAIAINIAINIAIAITIKITIVIVIMEPIHHNERASVFIKIFRTQHSKLLYEIDLATGGNVTVPIHQRK